MTIRDIVTMSKDHYKTHVEKAALFAVNKKKGQRDFFLWRNVDNELSVIYRLI